MDTLERVLSSLVELVTRDTTSGSPHEQAEALAWIGEQVAGPHTRCVVSPSDCPDQPVAVFATVDDSDRRLVFACHVDTVPVTDSARWARPPRSGEIADGRLWGRGATDMKAGLAVAMEAFRHAAESSIPAALVVTSDEEVGCLGAPIAASALADLDVGAVIVPEPTANRVVLGHRGALWLELLSHGRAAHGSTPELGENAIEKLMRALSRVDAELPRRSTAFLGAESCNLGRFIGGVAPNLVPDEAAAVVDMRTVGAPEPLLVWWREQPEIDEVKVVLDLPPVSTAAEDRWVRSLPADMQTVAARYFTDASVLSAALPEIPIVLWGPGTPAVMHAVDEYVELAEVEEAIMGYRAVLDAWKGRPLR